MAIQIKLDELVGNELTDKLEQALRAAYSRVRIKAPGMIFTMDYMPQRLNISVNDKRIITRVAFG
jgi:hypothetical protein